MIVNGTKYHSATPANVIRALEEAREGRYRIRVFYGDTDTGRDWDERYDVTGYVSRSIGPTKVPILLANARSPGGPAMLDHCIVRIRHSSKQARRRHGGDIYRHPRYHRDGRRREQDLPAEVLSKP